MCRESLEPLQALIECARCGESYVLKGGIWRFLPPERRKAHEGFLCRYRAVRSPEGWGSPDSAYYRKLPFVPRDDPQSRIWRIRSKSFRSFTRLFGAAMPLRVLDAGAGNCWLSNRLMLLGNTVASVDISDDPHDGLGAGGHYATRPKSYQAEFDHLPFRSGQFDMVLFNGSLHYTPALTPTLSEAGRVLRSQGRIVIMDSPLYSDAASGRAMVKEMEEKRAQAGEPGAHIGFLTETLLRAACSEAGLCARFLCPDANWHQRLRRRWVRLRIGREPARFPIITIERAISLDAGGLGRDHRDCGEKAIVQHQRHYRERLP